MPIIKTSEVQPWLYAITLDHGDKTFRTMIGSKDEALSLPFNFMAELSADDLAILQEAHEYVWNSLKSNPAEIEHKPMPSLGSMAEKLPGINELVTHPATNKTATLYTVIMDLNDHYKWSREQIADWIETLDIDINFKVKDVL